MKKRTRTRKNQTATAADPSATLIAFGQAWIDATRRGDLKTAIKARKQAAPILKAHPEYHATRPTNTPKSLYMDWLYFVRFLDERHQADYMQAATTNTFPPHLEITT